MQPQIVLFVARHGRTILNEKQIFRGDMDPPLDKHGFRDANELAHYFSPIELSFIVASDKVRALTTAEIIYLGKKVNPDEDCVEFLKPVANELLRPWNVGDFGGKPKNKENVDKLQEYINNPDLEVPGGTSLNDFRNRVRPLFQEAVEIGLNTGVPGLLVVHSSLIHEVGETFGNHHEDAHVKPGGVAAVYITDSGLAVGPIFKPDIKATTQNVLGTGKRSSLNS
jgi:broad specificity phosphatase PhoE